MLNFEEICKKGIRTKLTTEHTALELQNLFNWYFNNPKKLTVKSIRHASEFAGNLWQNCSPQEKQNIAKYLVDTEYHDDLFIQYCKSLSLYTAQFLYEKKIFQKLGFPTIIGSEQANRLITVHPKYLHDDEVIDALFLYLKKHGFENCNLVTSLPLLEIHLQNEQINTVICLGHGLLRNKDIIFDCGAIEGPHDKVVESWSLLLQKSPQIEHFRLLYCYYGHVNPDFHEEKHEDIVQFNHQKYSVESGRVTATVRYQPHTPIPFHPESFAGMLWQNLVTKGKRINFCLSATPLILNPLPPQQPEFFASCDIDHYNLPKLQSKLSMWNNRSLTQLAMTKTIRLVTEDSNKNVSP
jgi:hypothetical protein